LKTSEFDYHLPSEYIAQQPLEHRDSSRLLVLRRDGGGIQHRHFHDLAEYVGPGDLVVCNESRVIPARLHGRKAETGGAVEVLLLRDLGERRWVALTRGRRIRPGLELVLGRPEGPSVRASVQEVHENGSRVLIFDQDIGPSLETLGVVPLPPYIHESLDDPERYQTVYARVAGSAAAPTAGLHFTPALVEQLRAQGVRFAFVVVHIGMDTFRPIETDEVEDHPMHAEWCQVPTEVVEAVLETRRAGRRVFAVGTTAVRALETAAQAGEARAQIIAPVEGWTRLYIYPGYRFRVVDALVTNFHLPRSTLLTLVSAFAGRETIFRAYEEAVARKYRFYSFGDAMLIL
jgi:S-adenosylmethionine:tRNA ribosyltransferase-isomerase